MARSAVSAAASTSTSTARPTITAAMSTTAATPVTATIAAFAALARFVGLRLIFASGRIGHGFGVRSIFLVSHFLIALGHGGFARKPHATLFVDAQALHP